MKTKKLLLGLGSISTVALPIATVVSCGDSNHNVDPMIAIDHFKHGSVPTKYVPQDNSKWYDFLVKKRVHSRGEHGQTMFGLWNSIQTDAYQYGTFADSISTEFGFLQSGKLLMAAYYHKHPVTDANDIRHPLNQIGEVLQNTLKSLQTDTNLNVFEGPDKDIIKAALMSLTLDSILESSPKDLTLYDYFGFKLLAPIFKQDKYLNAKADSVEAKNKTKVMSFLSRWFTEFEWDLHEKFENITKTESVALAFAWQSVFGRSWDAGGSKLGDRKNASQVLIKNWVKKPYAPDHNLSIGNIRQDGNHPNVAVITPSAGGKQANSNKAFNLSGNEFFKSATQMADVLNDLSAKGIIVVDKGSARYDSTGNKVSGNETKRTLKFGLFKSITLNDGTDHVFDSDDDSIANKKSINGTEFQTILKNGNLQTFKFSIKDGAKWINSNGVAQSNVIAEDFWYAIQRKNYNTPGIRHTVATSGGHQIKADDPKEGESNSVAKKLETYFNGSSTNKASLLPPSKQEASQQPWYGTKFKDRFGMKPIKSGEDDHDTVVDKVNNTITFTVVDAKARKMELFWKEMFASPGVNNFMAISSKKVDEERINFYKKIVPSADFSKPLFKYGVYYDYIAKDISDFVYAGRYYPSKNGEHNAVFKLNPNVENLDKDTTPDDKKRIESITYRYIDQSGTPSVIIKDAYNNDEIYSANLGGNQFTGWRNEVNAMSKSAQLSYGLTYVKAATSGGDTGARFFTPALPFDTKSPNSAQYFYNDNMAKILYGDTIKNLWNASNVEKMIKHLYFGNGLIFRSTIQTAINTFGIVHDMSPGAQDNLSLFAPEGVIPGTGTGPKTVIESRLFNKYAFGVHKVEVDDAHYRDAAIEPGYMAFVISNEYHENKKPMVKTNYLDQLKENMKKVLDDEKISVKEFVISELPLDYIGGLNSIATARYLEHMKFAYEYLDKRLKFVANVNPEAKLK